MKKWLASIAMYILVFIIASVITIPAILFFAGPHSGYLPIWLEKPVLIVGWVFVVVMPFILAKKNYCRFNS